MLINILYYFHIFDKGVQTALNLAAIEGHTSAVSLLIDKGADINIQDKVIIYNKLLLS